MPQRRFNSDIYTAVPYMYFPNQLIFERDEVQFKPKYLAGWKGNIKSNKIRVKLITQLRNKEKFCIETTNKWLNHELNEKKEYVDLILGSKFSLCPAGYAAASYRIYESMALGRCPVILADDFVPPAGPHWSSFALFLPEKNISQLGSYLEKHEHLAQKFGNNAYKAWTNYFSANIIANYYADSLMSLITYSPKTSKVEEIRRWQSFGLHWSNKWTVPQRLINKVSFLNKNALVRLT